MKALTIWQPWASLIVFGDKRVENRQWPPPQEIVGQRIALHAGMIYDDNCSFYKDVRRLDMCAYLHGVILGTAIVKEWHTEAKRFPEDQQRWFSGPFGWLLADVQPTLLIRCRGAQKLWDLTRTSRRRDVHEGA